MAKIICIGTWPFEKNERVTLWWLRSPWRESTHRQWRITAVFKRESGELREVDFPWGLRPWLRFGQVFQNGRLIRRQVTGNIFKLDIPDTSSALTLKAADIPILSDYLQESESNLKEYCIKFQIPSGITIILPVLECIRAFLSPNKTLAFGLLEPNYFERVITQHEIKANVLFLSFSNDIAQQVLSKKFVFIVARLLYDSSLRSAWSWVYRDRLCQASQVNWGSSIPLMTHLPNLIPTWYVRGLLRGEFLWVQEILMVVPQQKLPFSAVCFTHPRFKDSEYVKKKVVKSGKRIKSAQTNLIETGADPPINSLFTRDLPRLKNPIIERINLRINRVPATSVNVNQPMTKTSDRASHPYSEKLLKSQILNVADVGEGGRNLPGEFPLHAPIEIEVETKDGLDEFAETIRFMNWKYHEVAVTWEVQNFPIATQFARIGNRTRKLALVQLENFALGSCWILEFGRPDNFYISTLLFSFSSQNTQSQHKEILDQLLTQAILPQGGWQCSMLRSLRQEIRGIVFTLMKHRCISTEDWGTRLYERATDLMT